MTENYLPGQPQNYQNEYNLITEYAYDGDGRQMAITDTLNYVTRVEYDTGGRLERIIVNYIDGIYDSDKPDEDIITQYLYDALGRRTGNIDVLGRESRTDYDELSRVQRMIENYVDGVYDANKPDEDIVTRYEYDPQNYRSSTFDTLNRETRTEYDELGRTKRAIVNYVDGVYDPNNPDEDIITSYTYDEVGNQETMTDALGRVTRTEYDDLNRTDQTIVNYVNGVYDPTKPDEDLITGYTYDKVGNQKTITDPLNRVTGYDYDPLNRVITMTNPLSGTTSYTFDEVGNRLTVTDAEGRTTHTAYDTLYRVITTTNALGGQAVVDYDPLGRRRSVQDANQHLTTYGYDRLGRTLAITDALGHVTRYTYNGLGNVLTVTDAENQTTHHSYDNLNRPVQTTNPLSGTTRVSYDGLGNRLTTTDANNHVTTYVYDKLNRLTQTIDPNNLGVTTTYDALGNRRSITNSAGETTTFAYDQANRLIQIVNPKSEIVNYQYDGAGNRVAMIDPSTSSGQAPGVETRYEYDDLDRLERVIENYVDGVYNTSVTDEDVITRYEYDQVGNQLKVIDARNNETTSIYDALNRRTERRDPLDNVTRTGYDMVGNRTVITDANQAVTRFEYDEANRLRTIDYPAPETDVTLTYDKIGNQVEMIDQSGATTYTYDSLYRLQAVKNGANQVVGYAYDAAGNRTSLTYPNNYTVTYSYDPGNRLETVTDWHNGQFGYNYDDANRLTGVSLPNGVSSGYSYDPAGRLELLTHSTLTDTIASYDYALDQVGNRRVLTETIAAVQNVASGAYLENNGLVVIEAEHFSGRSNGQTHQWNLKTTQSGYTGTSYLQPLPNVGTLYQTNEITASPVVSYPISFSTPGTYTLWLRGYASNASDDSVYVGLGQQVVAVTGFAPQRWEWADKRLTDSEAATLVITNTGVYTLNLWLREDGLRIDRVLLTTDTTYLPVDFGPSESERLTDTTTIDLTIDRAITYNYDSLYRLIDASYSTGEQYAYEYDPVGNRLKQIIDGDTTDYLYDAANRLEFLNGQQVYTFDANGNLLGSNVLTNTFDAANRLVETERDETTLQPIYNGVNDRVGQITDGVTTTFALDVQGLPEVIYTSDDEAYLHLPGVIVTEKAGEVRYLLSDGLGSVRQAVDETGAVVAYYEFEPYGRPVNDMSGGEPYGFTGEWYESQIELLHLRARWYLPQDDMFLSQDPFEGIPTNPSTLNGYNYANQNPINLTDPSGLTPLAGGPTAACLQMPACAAKLAGGGIAIAIISPPVAIIGGAVIVLVGVNEWICSHTECFPRTVPAPTAPARPTEAPPLIGTPSPCYWSADGCKPIDARKPKPSVTPEPGGTPIRIPGPRRVPTATCTPIPTPTSTPSQRTIVELGSGDFSNLVRIATDYPGERVIGIEKNPLIRDYIKFGKQLAGRIPAADEVYRNYITAQSLGAEIYFYDFGQGLHMTADEIISIAPNPSSALDVVNASKFINPGGRIYIAANHRESTARIIATELTNTFGVPVTSSRGISRYPSKYLSEKHDTLTHEAEIIDFRVP